MGKDVVVPGSERDQVAEMLRAILNRLRVPGQLWLINALGQREECIDLMA